MIPSGEGPRVVGLPKVVPFMSHDGPRLVIETNDDTGRHRMLLPPTLRLQLIGMLRRAQATETRIQERPLSIARVYGDTEGNARRDILLQYHERQRGNGVKVHRVHVPLDQVQELISRLWDTEIEGRPETPFDESLDSWLA